LNKELLDEVKQYIVDSYHNKVFDDNLVLIVGYTDVDISYKSRDTNIVSDIGVINRIEVNQEVFIDVLLKYKKSKVDFYIKVYVSQLLMYRFYDSDGSLYENVYVNSVDDLVLPSLPTDTEVYSYIDWEKISDFEYKAVRELKSSYFIGNVFQIMVTCLGDIPIAYGSGFVFDEEGYFITNSHVIEDGYKAYAYFDIPSENSLTTMLSINIASYNNVNKDIFIGKIDDYHLINSFYKEFNFVSSYNIDDITYSIGYPYEVDSVQVNKGKIVDAKNDLDDLYNYGVNYIGTTSYVAHGSSGGILINDKLEIIGITSIRVDNKDASFKVCGAVSSSNFISSLKNLKEYDFSVFLHPDEKEFINYYKRLIDDDRFERFEYYYWVSYYYEYYIETIDSYIYFLFNVDSDGYISLGYEYYLEDEVWFYYELFGYFILEDFMFNFYCEFIDESWFELFAFEINYSPNLNQTLVYYETEYSKGYTITSDDIKFVKELFNEAYLFIYNELRG